ncbi:hypothetical protein JCM33374_g3558 [Metschnikowia sp. JCM 33374]|nr:hypothetical protein JCM33374_g3558 [Metschnikowia sp. JCM 33374]
MPHSDLGQRIADEVVASFGKLNIKSGKPGTRSNGVSEWTVLAGLVAIDGDKLWVVSLATGVKAMPDDVRSFSAGSIVHDMHAEILCLRIFNWYLMEEIRGKCERKLLEPILVGGSCGGTGSPKSEHSDVPDSDKDTENGPHAFPRFRLRPSLKLALYISEPPCGDASMTHISGGQSSWENLENKPSDHDSEPASKKQKVVRGRANFDNIGVVRTKPGRADSKISYSKSCSDKLCVKQYTGILNCITSLRVNPVYLDYLVLERSKYHCEDFSRCFRRRLSHPPPHGLEILTFDKNNYPYAKNPHRIPSALSLVYSGLTKTAQVVNNGVKNGAHVKNKPPKPSGASFLCRRSLWSQAQGEIPDFKSYRELKDGNRTRQEIKKKTRDDLGSWPECKDEDFSL